MDANLLCNETLMHVDFHRDLTNLSVTRFRLQFISKCLRPKTVKSMVVEGSKMIY
jgi:hypothetical protein